nr:DUF6057 family protein [Prevotella sp.]
EYGRLRQFAYKRRPAVPAELDGSRLTGDFFFSDHVRPEMLESLYLGNTDNRLAYQYLLAYCLLTGDRERFNLYYSQRATDQQ